MLWLERWSQLDAATCFCVVLRIADLFLQTHPLSRGHAQHLPTFLTSSPDGSSPMCLLEASPEKPHPKQPLTHTHTRTKRSLATIIFP